MRLNLKEENQVAIKGEDREVVSRVAKKVATKGENKEVADTETTRAVVAAAVGNKQTQVRSSPYIIS
jgi:hypothetical protein